MTETSAPPAIAPATDWDRRFLSIAQQIAGWSKDPSTQVGAVIVDPHKRVVSTGFNGFPRGCDDHPRYLEQRDIRLNRSIHAEINAILFARRDLTGCTLYVWPMPPCVRCAVQIAQTGISRVVAPRLTGDLLRWGASVNEARMLYEECGIQLQEINDHAVSALR